MFEVNLVPDIKRQLLHTQRIRRLAVFFGIVVVAVLVGVLLILWTVVGLQNARMAAQTREANQAYAEFMASPNINASLTIQDQLLRLSRVYDGKKEPSRIFAVFDVILPVGEDVVRLTEVNLNFENGNISVEGQAQSSTGNDYRALQAFEQTIIRTYFDYGRYMDKEGNVIASIDIEEVIENGQVYGVYSRQVCQEPVVEGNGVTADSNCTVVEQVKIKRYMTEAELASADYYFKSECNGREVRGADGSVSMTSDCPLSPNGLLVLDRTSGRAPGNNNVVLRFDGRMVLDPRVMAFNNRHMFIIGPTRQNVTDSYTQIRDMFEERATDCASDDQECINAGGGQ
jgi:hypothetical protein